MAPGRGQDAGAERHKPAERIQRGASLPKASRPNVLSHKMAPLMQEKIWKGGAS
jgi:hypothetical protein